MKRRAQHVIPQSGQRVRDPVPLVLQILGLRWIPIDQCPPPKFLDFIGLTIKGPHDYKLGHYRFDGSGQEGIDCTHWFPAPALPKRVVNGFPPHDQEIGKELTKSLIAWIESEARR